MEALRQKLSSKGLTDVLFLGVNSKRWHAQVMASKLRDAVNFPIHQSTHTRDIFKLLGGRKDDVFVYDRCGRLAFYIPFPQSYVRYRYVEAAILATYMDEPCGPCGNENVPPGINTSTSTPTPSTASNATSILRTSQRASDGSGDEQTERRTTEAPTRLRQHTKRLGGRRERNKTKHRRLRPPRPPFSRLRNPRGRRRHSNRTKHAEEEEREQRLTTNQEPQEGDEAQDENKTKP